MNGYVQRLVDRAAGVQVGARARSHPALPALPPRLGPLLPPTPDVVPMAASVPARAGADAHRTTARAPLPAPVASTDPMAPADQGATHPQHLADDLVATGAVDPVDPVAARPPMATLPTAQPAPPTIGRQGAMPSRRDDDPRGDRRPGHTTVPSRGQSNQAARARALTLEPPPPAAPATRATPPPVSTTERRGAEPALAGADGQVVTAPVSIARPADTEPPPVTAPPPVARRPSAPRDGEPRPDPDERHGPVDVHIDTIEIVADAPSTTAPHRRPPSGFEGYDAIRSYDWGD